MESRHSIPVIEEQIKRADKIAILAHINPDIDAIASLVSLKNIIKEKYENKEIDIFSDCEKLDEINKKILINEKLNDKRFDKYDLAMVVDCPTLSRTGKYINIFEKANDTLVIDHHSTNEYFANNNICLKNASSTCEIIYFIAKTLNCKISDQICKILYSGIITDTANLTQGNITPRTYKVISQIAEREINLNAINEFFFKNDSKEKVMLLERAIHSLRFFCGDRLAIMKLTKEDFNQTGATSEDTYGLINHAINIEGVKIAAIIIEKDEKYFFSLRSKEGINVADIATKFGGGGHDTMAAFQYEGKWGDIKFEFIKACKEKLPAEEENTENIFFDIKPSNEEQNL